MKKMLFFITILFSFLPCVSSASTVTKNLLSDLGFYDGMWSEFLKNSDTNASTWQCGKISGDVVRYMVNGDVIAYDGKNHVWWHLFTPVSTTLPIEALALRRDSLGVVTTQDIVLHESVCSSLPVHVEKHVKQEKRVMQKPVVAKKQETVKSATPAVKKPRVKVAVKKVVAKPVAKVTTAKARRKIATAPVVKNMVKSRDAINLPTGHAGRVSTQSKEQKNSGKPTVVSTWELMELYRKQTGGD